MLKPRKTEVRIPYAHLNPALQHYIMQEGKSVFEEAYGNLFRNKPDPYSADPLLRGHHQTIRKNRTYQRVAEAALAVTLSTMELPSFHLSFSAKSGIGAAFVSREIAGFYLRRLHRQLADIMERGGVLRPAFEGHHPEGWMSPAIIAKTHPIFHVEPNGDLVFHKETRGEYFKWKCQGKFRRSAWWWREYLRPPNAPKPLRDSVNEQIAKMAEQIKQLKPRRRAFAPAPAGKVRGY